VLVHRMGSAAVDSGEVGVDNSDLEGIVEARSTVCLARGG